MRIAGVSVDRSRATVAFAVTAEAALRAKTPTGPQLEDPARAPEDPAPALVDVCGLDSVKAPAVRISDEATARAGAR